MEGDGDEREKNCDEAIGDCGEVIEIARKITRLKMSCHG
jgi:hypothetical protein